LALILQSCKVVLGGGLKQCRYTCKIMSEIKYHRLFWWIEGISAILLFIALYTNLIHKVDLIISIGIYLLLSSIFYFALDLRVVTKVSDKLKDELKDYNNPNIERLNKASVFINLIKVLVLLFIIVIGNKSMVQLNHWINAVVIVMFFGVLLILIYLYLKNVLLSYSYPNTSLMHLIKNFIFYYNKKDNRSIVDKPIGIGSTINFATKEGKFIFLLLLFPPIVIVVSILILKSLGKI